MFSFLRDKLKNAISKFKKTIEGEPEEKKEGVKPEKPLPEKKPAKPVKEEKKETKEPKREKPTKQPAKPKPEAKKPEPFKRPGPKKAAIPEKKPAEAARPEAIRKPAPKIAEKEEKAEEKAEERPEPVRAVKPEEPKEKRSFFTRIKESFRPSKAEPKPKVEKPELPKKEAIAKKEQILEEPAKPVIEEPKPAAPRKEPAKEAAKQPEKKGFFGKIAEAVTTKPLSEEKFEEIFWELEIGLLESNVAVEVIEKIKQDLKSQLVNTKVKFGQVEEIIVTSLEKSIEELFNTPQIDFFARIKEKKPYVVCFFGVNGSGKTTTIAKLCSLLQEKGITCVIAAADTFRAAAIHQLEEHAARLEVKVIKHDYGADPAAVAFDAVEHAKAKGKDVVLIDTAGRQHSNINLVDEMKKIIRVVKPDLKIFVGDSLTGNDVVEQSKSFDEAVGIDGIILTKADVDEKGGAALSVSYVTGKPIMFIGMGQSYHDLRPFDKQIVMKSLGLEA